VKAADLDPEGVGDYFSRTGTVSEWWAPEQGPLRFHYDAELQVIDDHGEIDPAWSVLDVGTGRGRFGVHFAERGCRVVGIDLNPDMIGAARETADRRGVADRFEVLEGRADDLSLLGERRFDVVLCMELFDHLPDLGAALAEMAGRLRPGGRLWFTYVPSESAYGALGNAVRWLRARTRPAETMISRTYTHGDVCQRLDAASLRLEGYWGIGLLCLNAQTRLFGDSLPLRALLALARAEARRWPYYERPWLARRGAHVVGLARPGGVGA
jgi:SAM-dependent methyltransferase